MAMRTVHACYIIMQRLGVSDAITQASPTTIAMLRSSLAQQEGKLVYH